MIVRKSSNNNLPIAVVFVTYAGSSLANALKWHHGMALGADFRIFRGLFSGLTIRWQALQMTSASLPLQIMRIPIGLRLGYRWAPHHRIRMEFQSVATFEYFTWRAHSPPDSIIRSGAPGNDWRFALGPSIGINIRLYAGLAFLLRSQVNFWLANTAILSQDPQQNVETLVYPHIASIGLLSGLSYAF